VLQRINPFFESDLSDVTLYTGSLASQIADEMGAQAFTLGKSIFGKIDFDTVEGLGLFAHEAVHTRHFDDPGTVDQKEEEAEAMEADVRRKLGGEEMALAFEDVQRKRVTASMGSAPSDGGVLRAANTVTLSSGGGSKSTADAQGGENQDGLGYLESPLVIEAIAEIILEWMGDESAMNAERFGF